MNSDALKCNKMRRVIKDRKLEYICLAVLIAAVMLLPMEITVVPAWEVKVVDESGNALSGVKVEEYW